MIETEIIKVTQTVYKAEDGTIFENKSECLKYEKTALFAYSKKLKRLNTIKATSYNLLNLGSDDVEIEIFDIQTETDLLDLKSYLYLVLETNDTAKYDIDECFINFLSATIHHEIIIFWNYEKDRFWIYGDGSLNALLNDIKNNYVYITTEKGD